MTDRKAPSGGARETYAAERKQLAPPLLEYPDPDGSPVFFDPTQVQAIREVVNKTRKVYTTLVSVAQPGGTTTVLILLERAGVVGAAVNMARRGLGYAMADVLDGRPRWQDELLQNGLEGAADIPVRLLEDAPRNVDESRVYTTLARLTRQDVPRSDTQEGLR